MSPNWLTIEGKAIIKKGEIKFEPNKIDESGEDSLKTTELQ